MKQAILPTYVFTPGLPGTGTLDLSSISNFSIRKLYGVFNATHQSFIYLAGVAGYGYSSLASGVLTLAVSTSGMSSGDDLMIVYEADQTLAPGAAADSSVQSVVTSLGTDGTSPPALPGNATGVRGWLRYIGSLLSGGIGITATSLPLPAGAATSALQTGANTTLSSILSTLQAQRADTLWTDDSNAYYVRSDVGGTVSWFTVAGSASSAPGTGARPVAGPDAVVDRSSYQATASGTGFSSGDYLDHIITANPTTGAIIGHYWINGKTETALASSPSSASITPLSPLPTGAATAAAQATILTALQGTLAVSATALPLPASASTDTSVQAITTSLGTDGASPPALAGTGVRGWLRYIAAFLSGTLKTATQTNAFRVTATGSLAALNATSTLVVDGMSTVSMQITGTWTGTIAVYGSMDDGVTYPILLGLKPMNGGPPISSFSANGNWERAVPGFTHVQAKMTAFTSGTASVLLAAFNGAKFSRVETPSTDPLPTLISSASSVGDNYVTGGASGAVTITAPGGATSHNYLPNEVITLTGGTSTTATQVTVSATQVVSAVVNNPGNSGTNGAATVTGTTGTGTKFQASVMITSGAISAINSITVNGLYTVNPAALSAEPVTGGGLVGTTLTIIMGVGSATISTPGVYTAAPTSPVSQGSSSGSGTGATFTLTYAPIAQTLMGGAIPVNGWKVNAPALSGDLWVSDNGVVPTVNGPSSFRVFSGGGGQYSTEAAEKPAGSALQLLGTTIGAPFIARRW